MKFTHLICMHMANTTIAHINEITIRRLDTNNSGWTLPPFTQLAGRVVVEDDHLVALVESLVSRTQVVVVRVDLLTVASVQLSPVCLLYTSPSPRD